jgi:integrase
MKIRLRDGSGSIDLKFLREYVDVRGKPRIEFRRKGFRTLPLKAEVGSKEFLAEYRAAFNGLTSGETSPRLAPKDKNSFRWLCERYYKAAANKEFDIRIDARTLHVRKLILDELCAETLSEEDTTLIGDLPYSGIPIAKIRALRDRKAKTPEAANSRLKALRQLFAMAIAAELPGVDSNPARDVPYIKTGSTGFHPWSIAEVQQFIVRHPLGTKAHLAMGLLLFLGGRRADAVNFGKQHARTAEQMAATLRDMHGGRWLSYTQHKNRNHKPVILEIPILPALEAILAASPCGDLTWLVTEFGRGFSASGFGNKFREWCDEANLHHCSAHGLRKAGATLAAENGATPHMLKAIWGWSTLKQAEHYTKTADQKRLAAGGMHFISFEQG